MTLESFRRLALALPETIESEHMNHPDFRVGGKIFATLLPDKGLGMVKLTPDQQKMLVKAHPEIFLPVPGGWGIRGATNVRLKSAKVSIVREALMLGWRNTAPQHLTEESES
jgi:hypothetical protein